MDPHRDIRDDRPMPVDVGTAAQLWWGVIGFGIINMFAALSAIYGRRAELAEQLVKDLSSRQPDATIRVENSESLVVAALAISAVVGLLVAALFVLIVKKLERGRNWARMLLTIVGVVLAIGAVSSLFGLASPDGPASLVMGATGIIQGVLAVGAIFLLHRSESNSYFLRFPPAE